MEISKELIFDFIKEKEPHILEVLDIRLDNSLIDYIVICLIEVTDYNIPIRNFEGREKRTCSINIEEFQRWYKSKTSIKWL